MAEELDLAAGATVLEFGCGPATVTPYLLARVGPTGSVIGVDIAEKMVARARQKAERSGWHNARFERGSTLDYSPPSTVDAVVFCLSLSTMDDCERCLERAVSMLEPGGQLVVLDSIPERSRPFAGLIIHLKAPLVGSTPTRVPLDWASATLEDVRLRRLFGGVYSLVSARKPCSAGRGRSADGG